MNYEALKEEATKITMDETKKAALTERLTTTDVPHKKRSPLARALPAAAVLAVVLGAGLLLWHGMTEPPAVVAPGSTVPATEPAADQTASPQETRDTESEAARTDREEPTPNTNEEQLSENKPPVSQGSANDETQAGDVSSFPADISGNMWCLREGETAPEMPTLIRSFEGYEPVKYYAEKGSYVLSPALSAAIEKYGDDPMVHYYVKINVIDPNAGTSRTWDEWEALYQREIDRMWTPDVNGEFSILRSEVWGETTAVEFALYLRDPAFLKSFPASPDYGYILELFDEQSAVK